MKIKTFKYVPGEPECVNFHYRIFLVNMSFISLHDLMFSGHESASIFIIILSSLFKQPSNREPKSTAEIEEGRHCRLRFIVANSKRAVQQCMLHSVAVFLTDLDKINQSSQKTVDSIQRLS